MTVETSTAATPSWLRGRYASWIYATDHRRVGILWLATGGAGLLLAAILTIVTALQTSRADASLLGATTYLGAATMQGTLLTYVGVLPLALGLVVAVLPLQIGARGLALSGLAAAGAWFGAMGGAAVVLSAFAHRAAPRAWWTTYPPLAAIGNRPGESVRLMGLVLIALGALLTAVAVVATLRSERAPGMTNARLPLFTQAGAIFSLALLVLAPASIFGSLLLLLARANPGSFDWYLTADGRLLHGYGWVFEQGIVTLTIVPALGVAAELVATFSREALATRRVVTLGLVATAVLVAIVPSQDTVETETWAAVLALLAVGAATVTAGALLPAAVTAVHRNRGAALGTPVPFALGAILLLVVGAVASLVFVVQHDDLSGTAFEGARLGLLLAAVLLGLTGGVVYWWPKLFGRALDPRATTLGAIAFTVAALVLAVGRAAAGWDDQPGRSGSTTDDAATWQLLGSLGAIAAVVALGLVALAIVAGRRARRVGHDPWRGDTLEWYTTSPPPPGSFDSLPLVESERPLADLRDALKAPGGR